MCNRKTDEIKTHIRRHVTEGNDVSQTSSGSPDKWPCRGRFLEVRAHNCEEAWGCRGFIKLMTSLFGTSEDKKP